MSTYLELVNKVIQESASELTELTVDSWDSPEAGRRLYPRIKRYVAEAWKLLQMERDEWEFKATELSSTIYPKLKISSALSTSPVFLTGEQFVGQDSGIVIEVLYQDDYRSTGNLLDGDWSGQIEFRLVDGQDKFTPGEVFLSDDSRFVYDQKGSYNFKRNFPTMREISWETFVVSKPDVAPTPLRFIPWSNWLYKDIEYAVSSRTVPMYVSQDFEGSLVFYPQTTDPFNISFVYSTAPQVLKEYDDVPVFLDAEFHDWIAWKALEMLASYDKNMTLFAYANKMATFFRRRAEKTLMPIPTWGCNKFDKRY